jgi:hypothetical protein
MANPAVSARTIFSTGEKDDDWEKGKKDGNFHVSAGGIAYLLSSISHMGYDYL